MVHGAAALRLAREMSFGRVVGGRVAGGLTAGLGALAVLAFMGTAPVLAQTESLEPAEQEAAPQEDDAAPADGTDSAERDAEETQTDTAEKTPETLPASMPRHTGTDPSRLQDQKAAAKFLDDLAITAFHILNDEAMTDDVRHEAFRELLSEGLAIDFIGRLMLGSHRKTATEAQLAEYQRIFPDYITRLYASQLAKLAKVRMLVIETAPRNHRDILVRTRLSRDNGEPIIVDWRVRKRSEEQFQIVDISVEGVSIVLVKRDEFNSLVRNRGFDALLAELQQRSGAVSGVL